MLSFTQSARRKDMLCGNLLSDTPDSNVEVSAGGIGRGPNMCWQDAGKYAAPSSGGGGGGGGVGRELRLRLRREVPVPLAEDDDTSERGP